ncbi:hypothetical protein FJTKL_10252 [Diaporthe vaccinii]|uniref:Uncharacterized protein n=1 Tax=Diaporthe vaccinii TaxID=105482 RepID=A0ABR4EKQ2_9PEZI
MAHSNGSGGNTTNGTTNFALKEEPVENLRRLEVRVVGAGFSGICAAIRIPERLRNIDLVVYEKNEGIGGVWWLNKYPGLACDIPSHSYQYSFAPNPHWSSLYAPGREIQNYLQGVAEKFGAVRFIKTQHKVVRCAWNAETKKWTVQVHKTDTGETVEENDIDFVITARGQLNEVAWPQVPGLETFRGKLLHSAEWDEEYDFRNKRVGVIGNGSSSIQIVPSLQPVEGVSMMVFMRSPTWISSNAFGDSAMAALGLDPEGLAPEKREFFASNPEEYLRFRKVIEDGGNVIHEGTIHGSDMQKQLIKAFTASMREKLAKKPELFDVIIPTFAPGCRRLTPGKGYLEALSQDNVHVTNETITEITETGVKLASGHEVQVDALACATGFRTSAPPPFEVVGRDGVTLAQRWSPHPESYLSVMVDGFPNYLMMFGPNSAIGFGSLTKILESECDYCVKILRKMQKEDYATIEPKAERVRDFQQYVGSYFADTVYLDKCKSWYRSDGGKGNWIIGLWPGSTLHALDSLMSPRWEDFNYETADPTGNSLRWLGNGWSVTETEGDPSWYLNPDEVNWPQEGKPEEAPRFKARPWSH